MKSRKALAVALSAATMMLGGGQAHAAMLGFVGSATATARPFEDPTCSPPTPSYRGIIPPSDGSGTSNLGSFTYSHNVCTPGTPGGTVRGVFALDFGASTLSGLLEGMVVPRAETPGLLDQLFTYTITGGSGMFANATGSFTNVGTVDSRMAPPSTLRLNFNGIINAPAAVPEPGTWVMMVLGFGMAGYAMRRRNPAILTARHRRMAGGRSA